MKPSAFVSGGSRGLGAAIVRQLVEDGYFVFFNYKNNSAAAEQLVADLGVDNAEALQCDITDFDAVNSLLEAVLDRPDYDLEVLVNNAGITADKSLVFMDQEQWHSVIDTNLNGLFNLTRHAALHFFKRGSGSIINMSSISGLNGQAGQCNYSTTKSGIIGFTKALAKELTPRGVRVNAIAPGYIDTDMLATLADKQRRTIEQQILMGRIGQSHEIAQVVSFLASPAAAYMTGQVLVVDGGLTL